MSDRGAPAGLPPLKGTHLAAGAWRAMQANARALLPIGLAYAASSVLAEQVAGQLGALDPGAGPTPAFLAYGLASGVFGAVLSGFALRRLLAPERGVFRLDLGLVVYVLLMAGAGLVMNLFALNMAGPAPDPTDTAAAGPYVARSLGLLILLTLAIWAWLRLTLWPIGVLLGDRRIRPSVSFRLMRRGVLAVILGSLILGLGPLIVYGVIAAQDGRGDALLRQVIGAPFLAFFAVSAAAVQAEAYRQRVLQARDVADTFD
ncbi:hypothetical protein [Phenylobacterium sp.]|uniref:hypothetical protein n=1 Tax=Phenylobacterium sp. TaxID=1871053 RepID=UPI0035AFCF4C